MVGGPRRSRSRAAASGITRRQFVAGGLVALGGGALLAGSGATAQVRADRAASVSTASDLEAAVGLDTAAVVTAGETEPLVTVTNNVDIELTVTVSLSDPSKGSVSPSSATVGIDDAQPFEVALDEGLSGGSDALGFEVSATGDGGRFSSAITRAVDVQSFRRRITDRTANTNAAYRIAFRVGGVADFDRFEVTVTNRDADYIGSTTYTRSATEGVISHPSAGSDGGAAGDTYAFDMRVYDTGGDVVLQRTVTDVADGTNPPGNDHLGGGPDDPQIDRVSVVRDDTRYNNTAFEVSYGVANAGSNDSVAVTFDNRANDWSDRTFADLPASNGSVTYTQGGTGGDTYDVTVEARNGNGITTDSVTLTEVADGQVDGGNGE